MPSRSVALRAILWASVCVTAVNCASVNARPIREYPFSATTPPKSFAYGEFRGTIQVQDSTIAVLVDSVLVVDRHVYPELWKTLRLRVLLVYAAGERVRVRDRSKTTFLAPLRVGAESDSARGTLRFTIPRPAGVTLADHWLELRLEETDKLGTTSWSAFTSRDVFAGSPWHQ